MFTPQHASTKLTPLVFHSKKDSLLNEGSAMYEAAAPELEATRGR